MKFYESDLQVASDETLITFVRDIDTLTEVECESCLTVFILEQHYNSCPGCNREPAYLNGWSW